MTEQDAQIPPGPPSGPPPESPPQPPQPPPSEPSPASAAGAMRKNAFFAGVLSLFPGAGNIYNGLYMRGVTFFVLAAATIYLTTHRDPLWGLAIAFIWIFNVLDAWRQANLINLGYATDLGISDPPPSGAFGNGSLIGGVAVFLFGLLAALEIYLDVNLDRVFDLWPVVLMALGAWFVFAAIRAKQKNEGIDPL